LSKTFIGSFQWLEHRYHTKGHMHKRGSKVIQDQWVLDQANYSLNQYQWNMIRY